LKILDRLIAILRLLPEGLEDHMLDSEGDLFTDASRRRRW